MLAQSRFLSACAVVMPLVAMLLIAGRASAADETHRHGGVVDDAKIFSEDAIRKADEGIQAIRERHQKDLLVQTVPRVPEDQRQAFNREGKTRFFESWAKRLGADADVNGVVVLICMSPGHVEVAIVGEGTDKVFTTKDRDELSPALAKALGEKQYDDALARTVAFVQKHMDANEPPRVAVAPAHAPATQPDHAAGGIGVVDLDRVAQSVGWQDVITKKEQAAEKDLLEELRAYQAGLERTLIDREKLLADQAKLSAEQTAQMQRATTLEDLASIPLPREQRDILMRSLQEANQARMAAQTHSRELYQRYQNALLDSYRQAMKPAVNRVAFDEGYTLVTVPQASLVYVDPSIEITDKVVAAMKKDLPEPVQPEKPTLGLEPFKLSPVTGPETKPEINDFDSRK